MQEDLLTVPPDFKLYKDRAVYVGTFLGGPLVAGYLAAENFKKLGQPDKARTAWIIAVLSTIMIFLGIFLIPGIEKIPKYIIPLAYTLIAQALVQQFQGPAIKNHIALGGPTYSVWRGVWIGLVGGVILVAIIFGILLLLDKDFLQSL
jgi:peptidoglycan/LPS O-acetylase OafA/YrhL